MRAYSVAPTVASVRCAHPPCGRRHQSTPRNPGLEFKRGTAIDGNASKQQGEFTIYCGHMIYEFTRRYAYCLKLLETSPFRTYLRVYFWVIHYYTLKYCHNKLITPSMVYETHFIRNNQETTSHFCEILL